MSGRDLVRGLRSVDTPAPKQPQRGNIVDLLIALVAVVAVASFGYFGYATWLAPRVAPAQAKVALASLAPQPTPQSKPPAGQSAPASADTDLAWTDADASRCKAEARAAAAEPPPAEAILVERTVTEGFAGLATQVECSITSKVKRFCAPAGKATLVAAVHDYLDRMDLLVLGMGVQGAPMAILGEAFGGEVAFGSAVYDTQKEGTFAAMRLHHRKVVAAIRALVRDGVVTQSDFGTFMGMGVPSSIKDMLKGVEAERNICVRST